ncbi:MAG: phosphodiesterase [Betaproteobacteria bacterium]|jgi:Icc protein|nr:MAG: phosphodiesterase [Betaproteobacteria bacterium]
MAENKDQHRIALLHLTDTHLLAAPESQIRSVTTQETLCATLNHARRDTLWPPDAIVVTGDIVQDGSRAGYLRFRDTLETFDLPVLCIPGNHDDPQHMSELLTAPPFQFCGDVKLGPWRIMLLNTFQKGEVAGALGQDRLGALQESLSRRPEEHVLICMHHQPIPMGSAWLDSLGLRDTPDFIKTIDRHDQVRAVLVGHVHQVSDRERNNVRFLSSPSTCFQFLPQSEFCALDDRPPGLRWVMLEPDGNITTHVDWVEVVR